MLLCSDLHSVVSFIIFTRGKLNTERHKSEFYEGDKNWDL